MIPVLNKIDLPNAEPERIAEQIEDTFGLSQDEMVHVSAKSGINVESLLPAICDRIPPYHSYFWICSIISPRGDREDPLKALLVDSWYDNYVGVVALIRVFDGTLSKGQQIVSAHTGRKYDVSEVGVMHPSQFPVDRLSAGQVGYVICGMKKSSEAHIGDTFCLSGKEVDPLPGFEELKSMVVVLSHRI
jgi:translation factor GUF1, mitochondrial